MGSIYTEEYQQIIHSLRKARITKGITQTELAEALDKPQSFVAKVENGEKRLDVIEFMHIAQLLDCDPLKLLKQLKINYKSIKVSK